MIYTDNTGILIYTYIFLYLLLYTYMYIPRHTYIYILTVIIYIHLYIIYNIYFYILYQWCVHDLSKFQKYTLFFSRFFSSFVVKGHLFKSNRYQEDALKPRLAEIDRNIAVLVV